MIDNQKKRLYNKGIKNKKAIKNGKGIKNVKVISSYKKSRGNYYSMK